MGVTLVAGGAGLLGSAVARALAARGEKVIVADRLRPGGDGPEAITDRVRALGRAGVTVSRLDLSDRANVERLLAAHAPDRLVNAARIEPGGAGTLFAAAAAAGVAYGVHLSDAALYGPPPAPGRRASEDEPLDPGEDPYLLLRAADEGAAGAAGMPHVVLRVFELIGPALPIARFPMEGLEALLADDEAPLPDDADRDYLHLDDAARGVLLALERRPEGVLNLGSGIATSPRAVLERLAERLGKPLRLAGEPGSPARAPRIADVERAFATLGFAPSRDLASILDEILAVRLGPPPGPAAPVLPRKEPPRPVSRRDLLGLFRRR